MDFLKFNFEARNMVMIKVKPMLDGENALELKSSVKTHEMKKLGENFGEKLIFFKTATETTGHGIPKIVNNLLPLQILWFIAFSASTAACALMIFNSIHINLFRKSDKNNELFCIH